MQKNYGAKQFSEKRTKRKKRNGRSKRKTNKLPFRSRDVKLKRG